MRRPRAVTAIGANAKALSFGVRPPEPRESERYLGTCDCRSSLSLSPGTLCYEARHRSHSHSLADTTPPRRERHMPKLLVTMERYYSG